MGALLIHIAGCCNTHSLGASQYLVGAWGRRALAYHRASVAASFVSARTELDPVAIRDLPIRPRLCHHPHARNPQSSGCEAGIRYLIIPLTEYTFDSIIHPMAWEIEGTETFSDWFTGLDDAEKESVIASVDLLEARGTTLGFPHTSSIESSQFGQMRELRVQHKGHPLRVLYAFDPRRVGLLLLGGDKTGNDRWYETLVPQADKLFAEHLAELRE